MVFCFLIVSLTFKSHWLSLRGFFQDRQHPIHSFELVSEEWLSTFFYLVWLLWVNENYWDALVNQSNELVEKLKSLLLTLSEIGSTQF